MALENTDTYDGENALIDLCIFLISQNSSLPKVENTFIFVELSNWRDCSLRDGVESYYETKDTDELNFLEKNMKQYARHEVCKKCISGIHIQKENRDFSPLDNWIKDYKGRLIIIDGDNLEFGENPEDFRKVTDLIDAELFGLFAEKEV